jgi:hypothetical protein
MPFHRRPHLLLALLATAVLVTAAAPDASAWSPHTRRYHPGRAITLDTDLTSRSGLSAWAIDEYLQERTPLPKLGRAFLNAERKYGVNARFLLAAAMHESGWGRSSISLHKRNLFGYNAYDRDPGRYATAFASYAHGIDGVARFMKEAYLTPGGRWWGGRPTLRSMQRFWSSSGQWGESVRRVASSIRLDTLRRRGIKSLHASVRGLVHAGATATVEVSWKSGSLPEAISFQATWTPGTLDGMRQSEASDGTTTPTARPVTVRAREARAREALATLVVAAPKAPGTYRLQITMLDAGRRPLPASDRPTVPAFDVRVWADRAVDYQVQSDAAGSGVVLRVTNTGRTTIPALPSGGEKVPADPEVLAMRTVVTLTATSTASGDSSPVLLVSAPLADDLPPGASLEFHAPDVAAATGHRASWLSAELRVLDDPTWLAGYPAATARWPGSHLGTLGGGLPAVGATPAAPPVPTAVPTPPATPQAAPTATPAPRPTATPAPTATPTPTATPKPASAPPPAPKPTPSVTPAPSSSSTPWLMSWPAPSASPAPPQAATPKPTARPKVKHVTRVLSEDSRSVHYRGAWRSASGGGYIGGGVAWSTTPGATGTITFTGRSIAWIGPVGPTRGLALVRIDGKAVARVSMHSTSFDARRVLFSRKFKNAGRHTLTVTVLSAPGHQYVAIDGFVVRT